jgi:hypothetical protein
LDEICVQSDAVSLCFLINRRSRTMRVIDFRAGPAAAKRSVVLSLAAREGVSRAYILVERDEVATWIKLGFEREGHIPGFYKRSDAFVLGWVMARGTGREESSVPVESETRILAARAADLPEDKGIVDAAHDLAERTLARAKKLAKGWPERAPAAKLTDLQSTDVRKPLAAAFKSGRALTGFEPFGRDVERRYYSATTRGGFELIVSVESQVCFENAFLEALQAPRDESERDSTVGAFLALSEMLRAQGVVSTFAVSASDDVQFAAAYVASGYRRTGLLRSHLVIRGERKDGIVWSRKLATVADE